MAGSLCCPQHWAPAMVGCRNLMRAPYPSPALSSPACCLEGPVDSQLPLKSSGDSGSGRWRLEGKGWERTRKQSVLQVLKFKSFRWSRPGSDTLPRLPSGLQQNNGVP